MKNRINLPGFIGVDSIFLTKSHSVSAIANNNTYSAVDRYLLTKQETIVPAYKCSDHSCTFWGAICGVFGGLTLGGACDPYNQCCQNPSPGICDYNPCQKGCPQSTSPQCLSYGQYGLNSEDNTSITDLTSQIASLKRQLNRIERCTCPPAIVTHYPFDHTQYISHL